MPQSQPFSYQNLFSKTTPAVGRRAPARRARYDFAVAYPDPNSLPLDGLLQALEEGLGQEGRDLALYPPAQGYGPLRELISDKLAKRRGMQVTPDQIVVCNGSMQAINLLMNVLTDPDDVVLTEEFFYVGTLRVLRRFQANIVGIRCDGEGMIPEELEGTIQRLSSEGKKPKYIYTIPAFQNPLGWTMTLERRKEMLRICEEYGVPVLEDDCYVDLRFQGEPVPAIHSLDDSGRVLYVGSFSKIIAPGIRLGYLAVPDEVMDRVMAIKHDAGPNQFASLAVERYSRSHIDDHIDEINQILRGKRDAMLAALGENFGSAATWSQPDGGLYIWLQLSQGADLVSTMDAAMKEDVGYYPGTFFSPEGNGANCARLCFGYNSPDEIHEGIARLARVLEREGQLKG